MADCLAREELAMMTPTSFETTCSLLPVLLALEVFREVEIRVERPAVGELCIFSLLFLPSVDLRREAADLVSVELDLIEARGTTEMREEEKEQME